MGPCIARPSTATVGGVLLCCSVPLELRSGSGGVGLGAAGSTSGDGLLAVLAQKGVTSGTGAPVPVKGLVPGPALGAGLGLEVVVEGDSGEVGPRLGLSVGLVPAVSAPGGRDR